MQVMKSPRELLGSVGPSQLWAGLGGILRLERSPRGPALLPPLALHLRHLLRVSHSLREMLFSISAPFVLLYPEHAS